MPGYQMRAGRGSRAQGAQIETAAFAFRHRLLRQRSDREHSRRPESAWRIMHAYFFFRRFVVFFFATRFAFFFVFLFAIGMSTTPLVLDSVQVRRLSLPQNANNMRGLHFGMQYCLSDAKNRKN
ncbi:MAG: hypothetical protein JOZ55_11445 [Alphaproteobacteria bacterium]|nr:hypothetical protein [Alphaproteobacteria bacterium]